MWFFSAAIGHRMPCFVKATTDILNPRSNTRPGLAPFSPLILSAEFLSQSAQKHFSEEREKRRQTQPNSTLEQPPPLCQYLTGSVFLMQRIVALPRKQNRRRRRRIIHPFDPFETEFASQLSPSSAHAAVLGNRCLL